MSNRLFGTLVILMALFCSFKSGGQDMNLRHRWVYIQTNLLVDKNVESVISLLERSAGAGYNGIVIADSKFMRWDNLPSKYAENARKVREACRRLGLDFIPCVFPIGYSDDLLSRDPNLAEGLPVIDAPYIIQNGKIVPDDENISIANPGFEQYDGNTPAGWGFVDQPGRISFIDKETKYEGSASLRMQDIGTYDPQYGHGRAHQKIKVRPFTYYHVSVAVKTQDFDAVDQIQIAILASGASLNYYKPRIEKTQDWKQVDITFNSLEFSEVNLYLGVWEGKGGTLWWDDLQIEPAGLVNVLRREGTPLRMTSEDGKIFYEEGVDFDHIHDPKLGNVPWAGSFSVWHEQPEVSITTNGRLRDGQRLLVSYYHPALIYDGTVMCCMNEPKVYEILRWQAQRVKDSLDPDGYFMSHDEIRAQGWDKSCENKLPGQTLAENARKCIAILSQTDPGKPVFVWSDMFDPYHNAKKSGRYYLVKGDGPWYGSWEGLSKDVIIVNWNSQKNERVPSMSHFASRGHKQILAGYYDGDPKSILEWLRDAKGIDGIIGVMYTTWQHNYDDLQDFAELIR